MPLNEDNTLDYWGEKNPTCPHCDEIFDVMENEAFELYEEGNHDITCRSITCGKEFSVESVSEFTFNTDEQE